MTIAPCQTDDLSQIQSLYHDARQLQAHKQMVVWPEFSESFLLNEIAAGLQWKIAMQANSIVCNWAVALSDPDIWGSEDADNSVYLHRICVRRDHRGYRFMETIVDWAVAFARANDRIFVRLDTLGNNTNLIRHYTSVGFEFLGMERLLDTQNLPRHYQDEPNCCRFQLEVPKT